MIYIKNLKLLAFWTAPLTFFGTMVATTAAKADALISTVSSTEMLTGIASNIWDVFYTNFPLIVGVVVLFTIVIALANLLLGKISSIGRHK